MAEVAFSGRHHQHTSSISQLDAGALLHNAPKIEMMPNPDFSFPALPPPHSPSLQLPETRGSRRPVSVHGNASSVQPSALAHRRHQSAALPTFSFNSADSSGLTDATTPPLTPNELAPETPASRKRGHKRGGSEFVGGDSRLGVDGAISSSPTKSTAEPLPIPPSARRHAHRRSGAVSSHDVRDIMQAKSENEPRTSTSLPTTPLEHPALPTLPAPVNRATSSPTVTADLHDPFGPPLPSAGDRPSSRPRVGFSDNVEFIPRPLSTISSETESSLSTARGHSVNNSISSVLSLNTSSPPANRSARTSLSTTFEDETVAKRRSSAEISKRIEKEGEWLKSRSSQSLRRPVSESATGSRSLSFAAPEPTRLRNVHGKKHSLSHALGLDRRRSEPSISLKSDAASRSSAISLQEELERASAGTDLADAHTLERRPSARKHRIWPLSKLTKKSKDNKPAHLEEPVVVTRPQSVGEDSVAGKVAVEEPPAAETDLDAVFGGRSSDSQQRLDTPPQPKIEVSTPTPSYSGSLYPDDLEGESSMVDLDAALGPMMIPPLGSQRPSRRALHSSRGTKDFDNPGWNYHRRAESAPELPPFSRGSVVSQSSLPDVFEGEGEEEAEESRSERPISSHSSQPDATGVGIHIVDAAEPGSDLGWSAGEGLRIHGGDWELERPSTSYGNRPSRLSTPSTERRPSSFIGETIMEEVVVVEPVEAAQEVEIVEAEDEPRASSLTKSSDSSETPTLLAPQSLPGPGGTQSLMTPDTYQTSAFSSPDFTRRQGSFDNSRVGTAASSIADTRTMSSCTGDNNNRISVDDVPSLTSSRSTMMSTMHPNTSHRDFSAEQSATPRPRNVDPTVVADRRRKRASIQSLSQLVGGSFSGKSKGSDDLRPQTAMDSLMAKPKKEHRLKKLMFWRSKSKQSLNSIP